MNIFFIFLFFRTESIESLDEGKALLEAKSREIVQYEDAISAHVQEKEEMKIQVQSILDEARLAVSAERERAEDQGRRSATDLQRITDEQKQTLGRLHDTAQLSSHREAEAQRERCHACAQPRKLLGRGRA